MGHDPQTSNGNQPQQQIQGGWNGISEGTLVSRTRSNGNTNANSNTNGWNTVVTAPFQHQQQLHERKQKEAKSGDLGDDEDGGGGGGGLEGTDPEENNSVHLKRRVGLVSGVALIVGTMIGNDRCTSLESTEGMYRNASLCEQVPGYSFRRQGF